MVFYRILKFKLIKTARLICIHNFECSLKADKSSAALLLKFWSNFFNQHHLVLWHCVWSLNKETLIMISWGLGASFKLDLLTNLTLKFLELLSIPRWIAIHNFLSNVISCSVEAWLIKLWCLWSKRISLAGHSRSLNWDPLFYFFSLPRSWLVLRASWHWLILTLALVVLLIRIWFALSVPWVVDNQAEIVIIVDATRNVSVVLRKFFQSHATVSLLSLHQIQLSFERLEKFY